VPVVADSPSKSYRKSKLKKVLKRIQKKLASKMTMLKRAVCLTECCMDMPNMSSRRISTSPKLHRRCSLSCGSSPAEGLEDFFRDLRRMANLDKRDMC